MRKQIPLPPHPQETLPGQNIKQKLSESNNPDITPAIVHHVLVPSITFT